MPTDLSDLPEMLLRREGPFAEVGYLPEWCFWFYVAEREGFERTLPLAIASGRYLIEDRTPGVYPDAYREAWLKYGKEWWAAVPRPKDIYASSWHLFSLLKEIEGAASDLGPQFRIRKRKRGERSKRWLTLASSDSDSDPARVEFDFGSWKQKFDVDVYHPLTAHWYTPERFLGYDGTGQVVVRALHDMENRIETTLRFFAAFLPIFASCTARHPPKPYQKL